MRRWILLALKLGISAGLLYWAFRSVDIGAVAGHLGRLDASWVAAALAALLVQIAAAGQRWAWIATRLGAPLSAGRAIRYTFAAAFLNQALPSTVGGDAMRVATRGYSLLKVVGRSEGLDGFRRELGGRFARSRPTDKAAPPAA